MSVHNLLCSLRRMFPFCFPSSVHATKGGAQKNPNVRAIVSCRVDTGCPAHEAVAHIRPGRLKASPVSRWRARALLQLTRRFLPTHFRRSF